MTAADLANWFFRFRLTARVAVAFSSRRALKSAVFLIQFFSRRSLSEFFPVSPG